MNAPIDEFKVGDMRRNVDSTGKTIPLYDPFDANGNIIPNAADRPRMQCNGVLDVICPDRIDPTAKRLIALLPHPDNPNLHRQQLPVPKLLHRAVLAAFHQVRLRL